MAYTLIFLLVGVPLVGGLFVQDIPLLVAGVRTHAVVTHVDYQTRRRSYLTLAFKVEDGTPVRVRIHQSWTSNYEVGEGVAIAYMRSDADTAQILSFSQMGTSIIMKILFGGTALGAAYLGMTPTRRDKDEKTGKVEKVEDNKKSKKKRKKKASANP